MKRLVRCVLVAIVMAIAIHTFSIGVLSAHLPRAVGEPDVHEVRTFTLAAVPAARIENQNGEVHVRVHDAGSMRLDATITGYTENHQAPSAECVSELIDVVESPESVSMISRDVPKVFRDLRIDYTLFVPPGTDISVVNTNGNVWISKGCGSVNIEGANTDIEVVEPRGSVSARSTNGRIRLIDAPADATLHTVNGNVYAHMLGGSLDASTINGAIVAHALGSGVTDCRLKSHNGGLTLVLHEQASAVVDAATSHGAIKCDWPIAPSEDGLPHRLRGTIGTGHTEVRMETLNGNIWITKE